MITSHGIDQYDPRDYNFEAGIVTDNATGTTFCVKEGKFVLLLDLTSSPDELQRVARGAYQYVWHALNPDVHIGPHSWGAQENLR